MAAIPMLIKIGPELQCFKRYGQNSNVHKNRAGIPIFERIKQKLKTSIKIGPEFQCLKRQGRNTSAYKDDA